MNDIQAGDLVILVRSHACRPGPCPHLGYIFTVTGVVYQPSKCETCGDVTTEWSAWGLEKYLTPISWLKKIRPLGELKTNELEELLRV